MDTLTLIAIAVALAMDAFAVSIAVGISLKQVRPRPAFRLSFHFGLFQALMPLLGWSVGVQLRDFIESYSHLIAFALLAYVGTNMIREAFSEDEDEDTHKKDPTKGMSLVMLSVATSIDALAVGFSLSLLKLSIIFPVIVIGFVALGFTLLGLFLGKKAAGVSFISKPAEILGGIVLWGIGIKIILDSGILQRFFS